MRILSVVKYTAHVAIAAILLAGCSNGSSSFAPSSAATSGHGLMNPPSLAVMPPTSIRPDHGTSWIDRKTMKKAYGTLWISDYGTDDVYIYTLPSLNLTGTITGFNAPQGMCTDKKGNVWIANTGDEDVLEYSPEGEEISSLSDGYGYPVSCAVSKSGDLAVTDYSGFESSGSGQVLLYKNASGTPTELSNSDQYYYYFATFDSKGNLFVDGMNASGDFDLSECAKGATSCGTIAVTGGTIGFPGGLMVVPGRYSGSSGPTGPGSGPPICWDCIGLFDQRCGDSEATCLYKVSIKGSSATIGKPIEIDGYSGHPVCDMAQGVMLQSNDKILGGGDYEYCGYTASTANTWTLPGGGWPIAYVDTGLDEPIGAAYVK